MNRAHHIEQTLPLNILDNEDYENCEFVLLDYNSSDELETFVKANLARYIDRGRLVYYRTLIPSYFHRAHALNTVFNLSTGNIVCNIDADNFTGRGFASYVDKVFNQNQSIFLTVDTDIHKADVCGRVCLRRESFFDIGGYDEAMDCWGHDDDDIKERLTRLGLKKVYIQGDQFLNAIAHDHADRLSNEYALKFLRNIYLCHVSPAMSYLLMLFNDHMFRNVACINNVAIGSEYYQNSLNPVHHEHAMDIEEDLGRSGYWTENGNIIKLIDEKHGISELHAKDGIALLNCHNTTYSYFEVLEKYVIEDVLLFYSYAKNRIRLRTNKAQNSIKVNEEPGHCVVYRNFDYENRIET